MSTITLTRVATHSDVHRCLATACPQAVLSPAVLCPLHAPQPR